MATYQNVNGDYNLATTGNLNVTGNVVSTGYMQSSYYIGDGQFLTNVTANIGAASILQNGTSNVNVPSLNGPVTVGVGGVGNVVVFSGTAANVTLTTASNSNSTGALQVSGGVGVRGNIYADALYANNIPALNENSVINGGTY
jgi:hypothetical protein